MHQKMQWRPGVSDENTKGIKKAIVVEDGLIGIEMVGMVLSRKYSDIIFRPGKSSGTDVAAEQQI
jgi:hypothetical protein